MIERVHLRLCDWVEEVAGGVGVRAGGSVLGGLIDSPAAMTRVSRRRTVVDEVTGERRPVSETATGIASRIKRAAVVQTSSMDVESAVLRLPEDMREAIQVYYFEGGLAVAVRAEKLKISVRTLNRRIHGAHVLLDAYLHGGEIPKAI